MALFRFCFLPPLRRRSNARIADKTAGIPGRAIAAFTGGDRAKLCHRTRHLCGSAAIAALAQPLHARRLPYLTFFPAVVITGFVFGVRQGIVVAVLSFFASWYLFIPPYNSLELTQGVVLAMGLYIFVVATDLVLIHLVMRAYRAEVLARQENQRMAEDRRRSRMNSITG